MGWHFFFFFKSAHVRESIYALPMIAVLSRTSKWSSHALTGKEAPSWCNDQQQQQAGRSPAARQKRGGRHQVIVGGGRRRGGWRYHHRQHAGLARGCLPCARLVGPAEGGGAAAGHRGRGRVGRLCGDHRYVRNTCCICLCLPARAPPLCHFIIQTTHIPVFPPKAPAAPARRRCSTS